MKRVVITGMGAVCPVGNNIDEFWHSLINQVSGIAPITRFDTSNYKVKIAAQVKDFDAGVYFENSSELRRTDLFVQYAVGAASQAVSDSAIAGNVDKNRFGVYMGSGVGGMKTFMDQALVLNSRGPDRVSPFFITMMITNMASGMVAMRFGAHGPTLPVVTACASSANTIGEAYRAIKHGYADALIAGGSESAINELSIAGFTSCNALSKSNDPKRASIPFDKERSGFVMGEGAGALILEEYEHAKARKAKIYAELCAYSNTCDAYHVTSPDPDAAQSSRAIAEAAKQAEISPGDKIYINAHGTSTPMNDKIETMAIKKAFGKRAFDIPVSSTKSMTGHMLGAAGALELIACVKALESGILPATIGYELADEECDLDYIPNKARATQADFAISTSFGFGGHNAVLVIRKI